MTVYDLGHKSGTWYDGIIKRAEKNADSKCWKLFWDNIPQQYHDIYLRGYQTYSKKKRKPLGCFFSFILCNVLYFVLCIVLLVFDCGDISLESIAIISIITMAAFRLWWNETSPKPRGSDEVFYISMSEEYEKFANKIEAELLTKELTEEFSVFSIMTAAALGIAITGHVGAAITAVKIVTGEEISPMNVVNTSIGLGGISDIPDVIDTVDTLNSADDIPAVAGTINTANPVSITDIPAVADTINTANPVSITDVPAIDVPQDIKFDSQGHIIDYDGLIIGKFDGYHFFDSTNSITATIHGNHLLNAHGNIVGTFTENKFIDNSGNVVYKIDSNGNIFDIHNVIIGKFVK